MQQQDKVIAVIDDNPLVLDGLDLLLSSYGYCTELYSSADEFVRAVEISNATCLLIDIELGTVTGIELARQLLEMGYSLPTVFMTGGCNVTLQKQAMELGCIAFLHKPFPPDQLIESIEKPVR